jgi:hypothetical protein
MNENTRSENPSLYIIINYAAEMRALTSLADAEDESSG